jgi:type I restriction-modification system DNA methylase subunit
VSVTDERGIRRQVDFEIFDRRLGACTKHSSSSTRDPPASAAFNLSAAAGHGRKTGSYYTPDSLVQCLLDSALDQSSLRRCESRIPNAILDLKVCDPACGSGHFLVAAASDRETAGSGAYRRRGTIAGNASRAA